MELVNPIKTPFAADGNKAQSLPDGSRDFQEVNWLTGFPSSYSQAGDVGGKFLKRIDFNYILNYIFSAVQYLQKGGLAVFNSILSRANQYKRGCVLWYKNESKKTWQLIEAIVDNPSEPTDTIVAQGVQWREYGLLTYLNDKIAFQEDVMIGTPTSNKKLTVNGNTSISGNLELNGATRASGCPTPTAGNHFANKAYVDNAHAPVAGGEPGSKLINIAGFKIEFGSVSINRTAAGATVTVQTLIENPLGSVATPRWYGGGDDMDYGFGCRATSNSLKISYAGRYVWNIGDVNDDKVDYIVFGT